MNKWLIIVSHPYRHTILHYLTLPRLTPCGTRCWPWSPPALIQDILWHHDRGDGVPSDPPAVGASGPVWRLPAGQLYGGRVQQPRGGSAAEWNLVPPSRPLGASVMYIPVYCLLTAYCTRCTVYCVLWTYCTLCTYCIRCSAYCTLYYTV